jgi:hypothetical protein
VVILNVYQQVQCCDPNMLAFTTDNETIQRMRLKRVPSEGKKLHHVPSVKYYRTRVRAESSARCDLFCEHGGCEFERQDKVEPSCVMLVPMRSHPASPSESDVVEGAIRIEGRKVQLNRYPWHLEQYGSGTTVEKNGTSQGHCQGLVEGVDSTIGVGIDDRWSATVKPYTLEY